MEYHFLIHTMSNKKLTIAVDYDYDDKGFYTDMKNIREAYEIAKKLVEANVGEVNE